MRPKKQLKRIPNFSLHSSTKLNLHEEDSVDEYNFHGQGIWTWKHPMHSSSYSGEWTENKKHGKGVFMEYGKTVEGIFVNDEPDIKEAVVTLGNGFKFINNIKVYIKKTSLMLHVF